ncbi:MAG: hypothetical protein QOE86_4698, partial [Solirubrobacteraceae bacterium]|nr:hypothetical protein [Solirubrobacteraceae bacterium]
MSLRRALVLALAYVLLLAIIALGVPSALNLRSRVDAEVRSQARGQADVVAATASDLLAAGSAAGRADLVRRSAAFLRGRVLIVDRRGRVVADSAGPETLGQDYGSRPEIASALAGRAVQGRRRSDTLHDVLLATAVPVLRGPAVLGAVRVTQSVAAVDHATLGALGGIALVAVVVLLIGLVAGAVIAGALARPLRRLEAIARRIAAGDLASRAAVEGTTEQRSLAQSFNDMADHLQDALESQQRFVADASHQLRTPLTGVRLRLEEARAATRGDDPAAEELDAGMREVDRLAATVEDLLTLSRAGRAAGPAVPVDTMAAVQATADRFNAPAGERGVRLTVHGATGVARVPPAALDRVLDALVENAVAYSPPGGEVELAVEDGRIAVMDRGPGLTA